MSLLFCVCVRRLSAFGLFHSLRVSSFSLHEAISQCQIENNASETDNDEKSLFVNAEKWA